MRKYPLFLILMLVACWVPHLGAFEAEDRMLLARTISAMAEAEPEEVARMIGEVALNRVRDPRFPDDLRSVLDDFRLFRRAATASARSVHLAERLLRGERLLPDDVCFFERRPGGYAFYGG
jgi:hypothetical protein